ncbi:hypothetical protein DSO57_1001065 [Entomophthora muscae]|nr:hypothetical protein DSO57_1001065 [Entomophthora muscae]
MRLQLGIAILDLITHNLNLSSSVKSESLCDTVAFLTMLFKHTYFGMNISIALNLHLAIICSLKPTRRWETFYWAFSIVIPLVLNIPLLVSGYFGRNSSGICYFRDQTRTGSTLQLIYNAVICSITIGYCLVVSLMVVYKVKKEFYGLSSESLTVPTDPREKSSSLLDLRSLIFRTCLYPFSCFLAYIGANVIVTYFFLFGTRPLVILYWGRAGYSSRGILHLFSFMADPLVFKSLPNAIRARHRPIESQPSKDSNSQHTSASCEFSYENLINSSGDIYSSYYTRYISDFKRFI